MLEVSGVRRILLVVAAAVLFNSLVVAYGFMQLDGLQDRLTAAVLMTVPKNVTTEEDSPVVPRATDGALAVVFYSDLGCEFCRQSSSAIDSLRQHFGGAVQWLYAPLPRPPHMASGSFGSARLLLCASDAEAGWNALRVAAQGADDEALQPLVTEILTEGGMEEGEIQRCSVSPEAEQRTWRAMFAASRAGVGAVPTTVVGGVKIEGAVEYEPMRTLIESKLSAR